MPQATLEAPLIDAHIEAEAIYAAEYEQQFLAQATIPEMTEAPVANDPTDFLSSRGLGGFRHMEISNPNNPNMRGTVEEALKVCPAFRIFVETIHKNTGQEGAIGVLTGMVQLPSAQPKQVQVKKRETTAATEKSKKSDPKAAEISVEATVEQPAVAELRLAPLKLVAVETPAAAVTQKTKTAAPAIKAHSEAPTLVLPVPIPTAERLPIEVEPEPVIVPVARVAPNMPKPTIITEQTVADHITMPTAETPVLITIPLNIEAFPVYTQSEHESSTISAAAAGLEAAAALPVIAEIADSEPPSVMNDEAILESPSAAEIDILPAEPVDLSEEVNALLIELGLSPHTAPEPDYSPQEITTPETAPEGALQLPQPITIETAVEVLAEPAMAAEAGAAIPPENLAAAEELPVIFQAELVERMETLSVEQVADIQPVADALLQAAIEIDELQLTPAATIEEQTERQAAAEQKLEALCVELLEALGLPVDTGTVKQFSRNLLKTEQFRHLLRIGRQQIEEGTHERLRSSLAWLQHLVQFIRDQAAACHHALGWSAIRLSTPRFATV